MTWDREHFESEARAAGDEFYMMGYNLINGPVAGPLGRTPYGGRMAEGFSPDPYLNGISMEKTVKGMNAAGVVTVSRHFLLNEQETNRSSALSSSTSGVYSSNADDKTIHELYLWPFMDAVKAGTGAIMCGMTKTNGTLSCENSKLVSGPLKEQLGFPGLVMPDVNSQTTSYGSANAGLDFGSSTYWTTDILNAGIANGSFTQARLDDMAVRNLIVYHYAGLDAGTQPSEASTTEYRSVRANHSTLIREIARNSLVLLKNENSALPLRQPNVISVFGAHADGCMTGPNFAMSVASMDDPYDGHLATGGGSGQGSMTYLVTPLHALTERARKDGTMIRYIANDTYSSTESSGMGGGMSMGGNSSSTGASMAGGPADSTSNSNSSMSMPGSGAGGAGGGGGGFDSGTSLTPSFENYAASSDVCLVFINSASGEGGDRSVLYHTSQDTTITTIAANCNNTIVIINTPGPRVFDNWIENENITAVLYGSLLGQESGNAIIDVLYGDTNPSGKLPYTIAKNETDYPVSICYTAECNFTEGVHIDYRYFDAYNISVCYPFGPGLSYTTFSYGDVSATATNTSALASTYPTGRLTLGGPSDLFDEVISMGTTIKNTGGVAGSAVAQLYVSYPPAADQPPKQLRGFEKVKLKAGEEKQVTFSVRRRDVSYWDVVAQKWAVAKGRYTFAVGGSSGELERRVEVVVQV
ncbi:Putative glycoside hydrolase, family 3, glycoside hydrolase family 3 domain, immunoglobulin [Septoria linicola]|uniref:beta-glucosidase n=1 Tax=Septoria linicola TaxID=215465 RepID=A0A9Q9AP74_9PEZI|nr:putative glycoside hydrolase, family 3, glycoside hydrolase family 3 domain, immunoglobulin [Septoria linicola]USW50603.1 Putative glycoside hydrolase, family 3, glycoside hydrolase family 3 domain, immunoglobulin [Septoria linicola]